MQSLILKTGQLTEEIDFGPGETGAVSVEYGTVGEDGVTASAGTVVLEGTLLGVAWYPLKITKNDKTDVDNLATPGIGWTETVAWTRIRARCSAGNTANGVRVALNYRAD